MEQTVQTPAVRNVVDQATPVTMSIEHIRPVVLKDIKEIGARIVRKSMCHDEDDI